MTEQESEIWNKIRSYEIGASNSSLSFSDRLARENGWTLKYTLRTILEYKRFMFLICICEEPLTPSDQVDQAWHLHLLYTRDYWGEFCHEVLGKEVHHGPTKGGDSERIKYRTLYLNTLKKYREVFEQNPPLDIWPTCEERFSKIDFRRISMDEFNITPKNSKRIFKWISSKN